MKKSHILFILVAVLTLSSCTTITRSMREPNTRLNLTAEDLVLSQPVSATATSVRVFGIDWARLFSAKYGTAGASVIGDILPGTANYAIYELLEENPGYDVVMYPQFKSEYHRPLGFTFLVCKTKTTVTARLGKLK